MTAAEQLALPAWEGDADRFGLTLGTGNYLCDIDYPIASNGIGPEAAAEPDLSIVMEMPTVLLPISPLASFDRLRKTVRDDFMQLLGEIDAYLESLGEATEPVKPIIHKPRRWLRRRRSAEAREV